jgi:DNA-binding GntR family transcriptional regulator
MRDVHTALRRLILDGELAPGSEISQTDLSRRLNCSRSPLRESLRLLEREGLIGGSEAYRLVRISSLSMVDVDDLFSLRVLGEGLAIWLTVPTLRTSDFEALEDDYERLNKKDMDAHRRFHARLRGGAASRQSEHLALLFEHAERYQRSWRENFPDSTSAKMDEHREILDACIAGDRDLARDRLVDHIAGTAIRLMMTERHAPYALVEAVAMAKRQPIG